MNDFELGCIYEELGECLLVSKGGKEAGPWFAKAYEKLKGTWIATETPDRLKRIQELSKK